MLLEKSRHLVLLGEAPVVPLVCQPLGFIPHILEFVLLSHAVFLCFFKFVQVWDLVKVFLDFCTFWQSWGDFAIEFPCILMWSCFKSYEISCDMCLGWVSSMENSSGHVCKLVRCLSLPGEVHNLLAFVLSNILYQHEQTFHNCGVPFAGETMCRDVKKAEVFQRPNCQSWIGYPWTSWGATTSWLGGVRGLLLDAFGHLYEWSLIDYALMFRKLWVA